MKGGNTFRYNRSKSCSPKYFTCGFYRTCTCYSYRYFYVKNNKRVDLDSIPEPSDQEAEALTIRPKWQIGFYDI